jgi:tRNA modification GTPase
MEELEQAVADLFPAGETVEDGELLTNARQAQAAERARDALLRVGRGLSDGMTPDAVLTDVEEAMTALGEITGVTIREDVTARIFERFCVGK